MLSKVVARTKNHIFPAIILALLAACGGGGDDGKANDNGTGTGTGSSGTGTGTGTGTGGTGTGGTSNATMSLSGQVIDGPVAGAQVCLYSSGAQVRDAAGGAVCSSQTDAQGNYTLTIPRNLPSGFLTLVATKGSSIKLASTLGTSEQVLAAGSSGTVNTANLPGARITHFTTADFALADTDNDGTVSKNESDVYVPDFQASQRAATVVKAVVDFNKTTLIGGLTTDTLALAKAASQDKVLGSTGQSSTQWFADAANANIISAVDQEVTGSLQGKFSKYQLSGTVTAAYIPPTVTLDNGNASIYCSIENIGAVEKETVEIAFLPERGAIILKLIDDDGLPTSIVGSYNAMTGAVSLEEIMPKSVVLKNDFVTYYGESYFKMKGTVSSAGNISGSFEGLEATTWTRDATRQACTNTGTLTLTKL